MYKKCGAFGCLTMVPIGTRYCSEHDSKAAAERDRRRETSSRRGYTARWREIVAAFLFARPFCEDCLDAGRTTKAELVHHVISLRKGGTNAKENLRALCRRCHTKVHSRKGK